jgi:sortase A
MTPHSNPSRPFSVRIILPARTNQPANTLSNLLRGAFYFFLAFGVFALVYAGYMFADSRAFQAREMSKFEQAAPPAEPRILVKGGVVGELQIPRLELSVMVLEGDSRLNLRRGAVHLTNSPLPGELGNVALAGHRDTFFRPLRNILVGDEITFKTPERNIGYVVETISIVAPGDLQVLEPTAGHNLTLVTCYPFYYVGSAPKRFIVRAREVDHP